MVCRPKYSVRIRNNETGGERVVGQSTEWDGDNSMSWWTEGNFSCDCNRANEFYGEFSMDRPCGDHRFTAVHAILPNGVIVPLDESY